VFKITDGSAACVSSASVERMTQHGWYSYSDPASLIPGTQLTQAARLATICKEGYQLAFKITDGSAACALPSSVKKMVEAGWFVYSEPEITTTTISEILRGTLGIACGEGYERMFKTSDGSPSCVKASSVEKLLELGWMK